MCKVCRQYPCHPRCPNAPEPPYVKYCDMCEEGIEEGEDYYYVLGTILCERCMCSSREIAESEG